MKHQRAVLPAFHSGLEIKGGHNFAAAERRNDLTRRIPDAPEPVVVVPVAWVVPVAIGHPGIPRIVVPGTAPQFKPHSET